MKVLATVHPGESVFSQLAPLLLGLRDMGHDVVVATSASFGPTVARCGLAHVTAGPDWVESNVADAFPDVMDHVHDPDGALIDFMIDLFVARTTDRFRADCARHIDRLEPDLVINSFSEIGGPLAAEAAGVPHLMFLAGADNWFERFRPAIEQRHGEVDWLVRAGVVVAEVPGWSAAPLTELDVTWLRPADVAPPSSTWSGRVRPMLHVTLGTVFNTLARPLFKVLATGAADVASSVVVTVGPGLDPERFVGLPANVEFHDFIPLGELLTGCDGVLGHAGWGTVTACAAAGVPMAALVLGADHHANAAMIERVGFGFAVRPEDCTADVARQLARRLTADAELRHVARQQRTAIESMPTPHAVAASLTDRFGP
jgi:UDP:flavonoid glycosyltransferase YjiC (YdhE family)